MPDRAVDGSVKPLIRIYQLPIIGLSVSPSSVDENGLTPLVYTFTRSRNLVSSLTVNYSVGGSAVNGIDYNTIDTSIVFEVGEETKTVEILPIDNDIVASDKTVSITLVESPNYIRGAIEPVVGTIVDDDTLPVIALSVLPSSVLENSGTPLVYTFTRTASITRSTTVNYTIEGTAVNGIDYQSVATSVVFGIGETTKTVNIIPIDNDAVTGDKTVSLTLVENAEYVRLTTNAVIGTIVDDDVIPFVTLAVSPSSVLENSGTPLVYTFTRVGSTGNAITVNYTISGTAVNGTDYLTIGTTVSFSAGQSTRTVSVTPIDNASYSLDKTVTLTLASGTGYEIGTVEGVTATIINDETEIITVAMGTSSVHESYGAYEQLTYIFSRLSNLGSLTVNFSASGATSGVDYSLSGATSFDGTNGTILLDGVSSNTLIVTPINVLTDSINKTLTITVESGGYIIGSPSSASGTIISNPRYCEQDITGFYDFATAP